LSQFSSPSKKYWDHTFIQSFILIGVKIKRRELKKLSQDEKIGLWVAEVDGKLVGYIAYELSNDKTG